MRAQYALQKEEGKMMDWLKNILGSKEQTTPEFLIEMKGTTGFVTNVDSLFKSRVVKQQAELASKHVAKQQEQLSK
ncbi:hypothetical protein CWC22_014785 [Pseudoalteromonas rubra]|uniref:Uncharacterized protein n=1 Tax=Pseudoalteromonas rubra TaxID=43658 RepID=A0A5S3UUY1_9GAMM|nr:hypothetical protein [Pseudoalteromonas rubra]QPB84187.1 hypothetical protein CWC22_014785 [Pseudoalteromonas rubra]